MKKSIAIYLRVSTSSQNTDLQKNDLIKYASQRDFTIFKIYSDIGISGSKEKRPALDELMKDARTRKFDLVLVWAFDRAARSSSHLIKMLEEFQTLNIDFISHRENIDTSSPMGKAMFTIISAMAELERNLIRSRVIAGLKAAKERGVVLGRERKHDYEKVIQLREQGLSLRKIVKELGIPMGSVQRALKLAKK